MAAAGTARGQVELIVRVADAAPGALVSQLEGTAAKQGGGFEDLFQSVSTVRPVVRIAGASKRGAALPAYVLAVPDSAAWEALRARWQASSYARYVQPNHAYRLDRGGLDRGDAAALRPPSDDPMLDSLAHLDVIRVPEAWEVTDGAADVRIGFVDTGVYLGHPDLEGQMAVNPGEDVNGNGRVDPADWNGLDDDGNGYVDDLRGWDFVDRPDVAEQGDYTEPDADPSEDPVAGLCVAHGTTVAGVLGAARANGVGAAGVAPGARLVPLRAFGADGRGHDDDVAAAIVYAADQGLDVLNLSFGDSYYSPLMHEAVRYAVDRGTIVVASAGNLGGDAPHYPSDYPEVISTVWLTADGTSLAGRAAYGPGVDLGAPGSFIYTTQYAVGDDGAVTDLYGRCSGSSMAAPMVAAAAALLRSVDPSLSPASVRSILAGTAVDVDDPGWDRRTGAGRLNAAASVRSALPGRVDVTSPAPLQGFAGGRVPVVGTVVDPSFEAYQVFVRPGDDGEGAWTALSEPVQTQSWNDTLAVWDTDAVEEGLYTLRLRVERRVGQPIEERRRVYVDRTAPVLTPRWVGPAIVDGRAAVQVDVAVDDVARVDLVVRDPQTGRTVGAATSDRLARRHGLVWTSDGTLEDEVTVVVVAANTAGAETRYEQTVLLPAARPNAAFLAARPLQAPSGYLLPSLTDFDGDGLREVILNAFEQGAVGDTLSAWEWDGDRLRRAGALVANVLPRDVGDTDGDGRQELLTQVAGATLLLEQPPGQAFPSDLVFVDTTGLGDPFGTEALYGARLTDLDEDGRGEILAHNTTQWRLLEWDGGRFVEVARLDNPTGLGDAEVDRNELQQPRALVGDADDDGRPDVWTGDNDGDWILWEQGADGLQAVWSYETNRYNAGDRFARGDFDGDGRRETATFTQNWTQLTRDGEREPDFGVLYLWAPTGDDAFDLVAETALPGEVSRYGALAAADFDGDGRDELVVAHAADLYVLRLAAPGRMDIVHHAEAAEAGGVRSPALATGDLDGDGRPDVIAGTTGGGLYVWSYAGAPATVAPPVWRAAYARDAARVVLRWDDAGADSTVVFAASPDGPFGRVTSVPADSVVLQTDAPRRYALRAYRQGLASVLSEARTVRPHAPAALLTATRTEPGEVLLRFSAALHPATRAAQFVLEDGRSPRTLLLVDGDRSVVLGFGAAVLVGAVLRWDGVRDREETPVGATRAVVQAGEGDVGGLIVASWSLRGADEVVLTFNDALLAAPAADVANYRLEPAGRVRAVRFDPARPREVIVEVEGRAIGATGLETRLRLDGLQSAGGLALAPEGAVVRLTAAAADLSDVYVFPNPVEPGRHAEEVVVAGLTRSARVRVMTPEGQLVRRLEETDGDGGVRWDLRDERGGLVPSGVYLVYVEADGAAPALRKLAVVR